MTDTQAEKPSRGSRGTASLSGLVNALGGVSEGLQSHLGYLQYEDAQKMDDAFIIAICDEIVDDEGEGLRDISNEVMDLVDRASTIYAGLHAANPSLNRTLAGRGRSDEAVAALEDFHKAILWEMTADKGGLQDHDEDDFDYYESLTEIYRRLR